MPTRRWRALEADPTLAKVLSASNKVLDEHPHNGWIYSLCGSTCTSPAPDLPFGHQLRLLGQLFLNADREQTIADLEAATAIPQQTVSREIDRLVLAGLLNDRRQGRMRFVRPDPANLYYPELSRLLLKALGPRSVLAQQLERLSGIDDAYLYGSWARRYEGEPGPPPRDIDVVVIGDPDLDRLYDACREAGTILGQEVNPVTLTPDEWTARRSGFVRELRAGPLVRIE